MSRTTLVTGGTGFIGSHLCESLVADGHRVVCLDNLSSGRRENLTDLRDDDRFMLVVGDVRDEIGPTLEDAGAATAAIDRIYHLASRASPVDFRDHPLEITEANSTGTANSLSFARDVGARVLYASTSEVYGEPEVHPQPESYFGHVDSRSPRSPYHESKRYGEMLLATYSPEYGLDPRTARLFNTFGPRMRPDDGRVVPNFLSQALSGRDLTVYGDGSQTRSFLYVDDLVHGLLAFMNRADLGGEVMNFGSTSRSRSVSWLS